MVSNPIYNLTWGEYGTSLISAVQLLRCHGDLVDVTLAAGGRTFHAHKVVLCAASPFLLDLLKSTTCKHPIVMLPGVQAADLEALLEFVYRGEVSIDQNQLPSLLQAAHCLNIQGLAPSSQPVHNETAVHQVKTNIDIPKTPEIIQSDEGTLQAENDLPIKRRKRVKRFRSPPTEIPNDKVYIQAGSVNENVSDVPTWTQQMNIINVAPSSIENFSNQSVQNIVSPISTITSTKTKGASDQPGACPLCGAMLRQARNLRRHLVTSCKYRMLNGIPQIQVNRELLQLNAASGQSIEHVSEDVEHLETKSDAPLTPISCAELITNTNIVHITSNNMS